MHGIDDDLPVRDPDAGGAFFNFSCRCMIGARDMAFPRLNALSYWIYLAAGIFLYVGCHEGRRAQRGLVQLRPARDRTSSPAPPSTCTAGPDLLGISTTAAALNFIVTIINLRAPGMSMMRVPVFTLDDALVTSRSRIILSFPAITSRSVPRDHDGPASARTSSRFRTAASRSSGSTCSGSSGTRRSTS